MERARNNDANYWHKILTQNININLLCHNTSVTFSGATPPLFLCQKLCQSPMSKSMSNVMSKVMSKLYFQKLHQSAIFKGIFRKVMEISYVKVLCQSLCQMLCHKLCQKLCQTRQKKRGGVPPLNVTDVWDEQLS